MNFVHKLLSIADPNIPDRLYGASSGVVVGQDLRGRALVEPEVGRVLVIGPYRSGKTSGVIIPTLLSWEGRALVLDPRGDVERATRAWRSELGETQVLRPGDRDTWTFRALPFKRTATSCERLALALTSNIIGPHARSAFELAYRSLLAMRPGLHLHELLIPGSGEVARVLRAELEVFQDPWVKYCTSNSGGAPKTLYIQGDVISERDQARYAMLARLACVWSSPDVLHLLDDAPRYSIGGDLSYAPRRVVTLDQAHYVSGAFKFYELREYHTVVVFGQRSYQDVPVCLVEHLGIEPSQLLEQTPIIRLHTGEVFRAQVMKPRTHDTYRRRREFSP